MERNQHDKACDGRVFCGEIFSDVPSRFFTQFRISRNLNYQANKDT